MNSKIGEVVRPPNPPVSMSPAAQKRRLRALLEHLDWSQAELALRTGISTQNINRYCQGKRQINPNDAWKIANATGLTVGYILHGDVRGLTRDQVAQMPDED
jgi:transcriptional regulator with XRE-family HTH domain